MQSFVWASLLLVMIYVAPALAADRKPDIALKAKYIEVGVSFDDDIKADAPLLKNLTGGGKAWSTKTLKELVKQRKDLADQPDTRTRPWDAERSFTQRSVVDDRYVSIVRSDYSYTGGAHPNHAGNTLLWDRRASKMISIRPFFTELADNGPAMTAIRNAVVADLKREKKKKDADNPDMSLVEALQPKLSEIGAISLAPSKVAGKSAGLTFHYSPYAVGSYAEGEYMAFVPWETFKAYLTPDGVAIFSGARAAGDGEGPQ